MVSSVLNLMPAVFLMASVTTGEIATVETTADAAFAGGKLEATKDVLTVSGPNDAVLIRFRTSLIKRWSIQKAVIALHVAENSPAPSEVIVGVTFGQWTESSSTPPQLTSGDTEPVRTLKDGWISFELPAKVATQLAFGHISSVSVSVPEGQRLSVHSRRTVQFMPYLLVRGSCPLVRKGQ